MAASSSQPETMKAECSLDNPKASYSETSDPMLHVTLLGGEWSSSAGGLSTLNRELAIHLSNHSAVKVSLLVPEGACNYEEKNEAHTYGITIVEAKRLAAFDRLDWLSFPPHEHLMDIVVGHGVKLGRQIQVIRDSARFTNCKWVQVVHTAPEDLSKYKCYGDPISKGETKHESEVELCKLADLVVPVGPKLKEMYTSYLQRCKTHQDVLSITPGLFQREFGDLVAKQDRNEDGEFRVLLFGRGDDEDFELKGYNIAAKAFTDQRLKNKPYHLIFVGAPEGKQQEVREKLLQRGIAEAQLTVRKFIQSRERLKDLLCEADLAIMPSKSEGFGLVALEALSAGLPILVGSRSGFAKALENVPIGFSCIVNSDDPAEWTKEIEAVRSRHRMRLQEIKSLRTLYGEMYSWKEQCETLVNRMQRMGHEPSMDIDNNQRTNTSNYEQPVSETSLSSDCEMKAEAASGNPTKISTNTDSQSKHSRKRKMVECSCNPGTSSEDSGIFFKKHMPSKIASREGASLGKEPLNSWSMQNIAGSTSSIGAVSALVRLLISLHTQDLSDEQQEVIVKDLEHRVHMYQKYHDVSTPDSIRAFTEYLEKAFNVAILMVESGSLIITVQCPNLESLESLWNDYQSGHLNDIAETFLVTDELKTKLGMDNIRLKTTIEEENYLICKMAFMEISGLATINESSSQTVDSGQVEDPRLDGTKSDVVKDKKQVLTPMARAEKAKASRGPLHKAAISGQYETIKMLLESGEDVDQRDQFSLTPLHLACWYGQESVVKLLLEHGANINAEDRFQRTPLQKAERQNHHSIVQLLQKNDARPSLHQPISLKKLSRKAFLQVDEQSGFNMLQAAVLEGEYETVLEVSGLLGNFLEEMELTKTGDNAKGFPGESAVGILSLIKRRKPRHDSIERLYKEWAKDNSRLGKLQWATLNDDAEQAVELALNDGVDVNASGSNSDYTALLQASLSSSSQFIETIIDLGADVNAQRKWGDVGPLLLAADWNNYMAACLFLRHGADVNVQSYSSELTPLHLSIRKNHENLVKLLLANKADVNAQGEYVTTPLLWSVRMGEENLVRLLLKHDADVNIQDHYGHAPLHRSIISGNENLVRLLLEYNASINIRNNDGETPLHWSVRKGDENLVRMLLDHKADVNIQDYSGETPLHWSIIGGDENLVRLLLERNPGVDIQDYNGETPLHFSVSKDDENLMRILLEHSACVNIQDYNGETPMHYSARKGEENLIRLLLEHSANVNIQDRRGYIPLHWAVKKVRGNEVKKGNKHAVSLLIQHNAQVNHQDKRGYTPLVWSIVNGDEELVRVLLEHNAGVNIQDEDGETPLHWSVFKGEENLVRSLLEHNAEVNVQDNYRETPLHLSVKKCDENLLRLLLEHNADVNLKDGDGKTPLHLSTSYSYKGKIIDLLIKHGAQNINSCDTDGLTPLHIAVRCGNARAVKKLLDQGADVSVITADNDAVELKRLKIEAV